MELLKALEKQILAASSKSNIDRMKKKYEDKLKVLEVEMSENTKGSIDYQSTVATIVSLCRRSRELFDSSEVGEKTQIINYVFQNLTVNEKTPCFTMRSPFDLMFELASSPDLLRLSVTLRTCVVDIQRLIRVM
jgi:hypothetical protein